VSTTILSPHLDDAVLSCFAEVLAGARVITIYSGVPSAEAPVNGWDRTCGFDSPREHARVRLAEDEALMLDLGVVAERWGYVDFPNREYGPRPSLLELAQMFTASTADGDVLFAPIADLSPSPHPDHVDVKAAALATGRRVKLYADLPHALKQVGEWPSPIGSAALPPAWAKNVPATPFDVYRLSLETVERKAAAMRAYASQFRPLGRLRDVPSRRVLRRPEVYGIEVAWEAP